MRPVFPAPGPAWHEPAGSSFSRMHGISFSPSERRARLLIAPTKMKLFFERDRDPRGRLSGSPSENGEDCPALESDGRPPRLTSAINLRGSVAIWKSRRQRRRCEIRSSHFVFRQRAETGLSVTVRSKETFPLRTSPPASFVNFLSARVAASGDFPDTSRQPDRVSFEGEARIANGCQTTGARQGAANPSSRVDQSQVASFEVTRLPAGPHSVRKRSCRLLVGACRRIGCRSRIMGLATIEFHEQF